MCPIPRQDGASSRRLVYRDGPNAQQGRARDCARIAGENVGARTCPPVNFGCDSQLDHASFTPWPHDIVALQATPIREDKREARQLQRPLKPSLGNDAPRFSEAHPSLGGGQEGLALDLSSNKVGLGAHSLLSAAMSPTWPGLKHGLITIRRFCCRQVVAATTRAGEFRHILR